MAPHSTPRKKNETCEKITLQIDVVVGNLKWAEKNSVSFIRMNLKYHLKRLNIKLKRERSRLIKKGLREIRKDVEKTLNSEL